MFYCSVYHLVAVPVMKSEPSLAQPATATSPSTLSARADVSFASDDEEVCNHIMSIYANWCYYKDIISDFFDHILFQSHDAH